MTDVGCQETTHPVIGVRCSLLGVREQPLLRKVVRCQMSDVRKQPLLSKLQVIRGDLCAPWPCIFRAFLCSFVANPFCRRQKKTLSRPPKGSQNRV